MSRSLLLVGGSLDTDLYVGKDSLADIVRKEDPLDKLLADYDWLDLESRIMDRIYENTIDDVASRGEVIPLSKIRRSKLHLA